MSNALSANDMMAGLIAMINQCAPIPAWRITADDDTIGRITVLLRSMQ